ncbi:3-dehydroquinate synthase [Sediminitomix flava]|uniref:3-dehydroquinate synthase n=1 Tax=Sediminitomix flava TaxID=379075 RepID=A0A315ZFQ3_SEDFL|nr:3-dehydroquinate synthase [Sediminitomix flava]PWJ43970.1 3-dehydroquinate synthase [Sediminitomix flava]
MSLNNVSFLTEINKDVFSPLEAYSKVAVIVDENTLENCYPIVKEFLPEDHLLIQVKSGEEEKNLQTCTHIWQQLTDEGFDRKGFVLNLGGGVIGDMGGFCASTYKRGIKFWQMPTTLLSQVDASVGGKLGIDFHKYKNHIGVFQIPDQVLIFPDFIKSLPQREVRSGYAEILKHALIADGSHWKKITQKGVYEQDWTDMIPHSVGIKSDVVDQDPKENSLRKILNYGHSVGHAIESYLLDIPERKLLHGEAIAVGMICEAFISTKKCSLTDSELSEVTAYLLQEYGYPTISESDFSAIHSYLLQDKKNESGKINMSLISKIGKAEYDQFVNWEEVEESLKYYISLKG